MAFTLTEVDWPAIQRRLLQEIAEWEATTFVLEFPVRPIEQPKRRWWQWQ